MSTIKFLAPVSLCLVLVTGVLAQQPLLQNKQVKFRLNENGDQYVRLTFLSQVWLRYTDLNPGSTVNDKPVSEVYDIGLRRTRLQLFGQLTDRVFFYTQFGQNNFNYLSEKQSGSFFHDVLGEYRVAGKGLSIGGGLTAWSGLSRYASPSTGSILSMDPPIYQQATNGVNDQFARKLSIYAKGQVARFDYRFAITNPMIAQNSGSNEPTRTIEFSADPPELQYQGYVKYQFMDEEDNTTPYATGSYLGSKSVFNIGVGAIYQKDAMWKQVSYGRTAYRDMLLLGADIYFDAPLNEERGNALTFYTAFNYYNFGKEYFRNVGVMNPANGVNENATLNGQGNAFPMIGTGKIIYCQTGYLFKKGLLPGNGTIQPYGAVQFADYDILASYMLMVEGGLNWFIHGSHEAKISVNLQNRPVFDYNNFGKGSLVTTRNMIQLQFQVAI